MELTQLIDLSKTIGSDVSLVQGGGGNISIKAPGGLTYIKASGTPLKAMSLERGVVGIAASGEVKFGSPQHASMEWPMHLALRAPWVCHTHSVYLNVFSCMVNGTQQLRDVLSNLDFILLSYVQPGAHLAQAIQVLQPEPKIVILKNHGLLVTADSAELALQLTQSIHQRCAAAMQQLFTVPTELLPEPQHYYFPDAAILSTDPVVRAANAYIEHTIQTMGGTPQPLTTDEIASLRSMDEEQYRINLKV